MLLMIAAMMAAMLPAVAEDLSRWSAVEALKPGTRIGVIRANMKRVEGTLTNASPSSVVVQADQPVTLDKADIVRVYRRPKLNRATHAALGAGAGLVLGLILNETAGKRFSNEGQDMSGALIGGSIAVGAGLGALGGGNDTIYRRP